ncbi:MAG: chemotaxis response regulator protein-glutamate methylesterase [Desulfobulbaceae bacterium A2]|nr:MAG: chemotaxis response regulator protein-glutamate methylesterase [Desulfobulbaceae bacterium A2]
MDKIRVVITDDSSLARGLLREFIATTDDIEVVGEAGNGRQAVDLVQELHPDLVTMDLEMPVMNGMEAIAEIMCTKAVPILVVSSVADAHIALEAVSRGALEVVAKPSYTSVDAADFVAKVRLLAGVSVITRPRTRNNGQTAGAGMPLPVLAPPSGDIAQRVFAIAASTGGPQALAEILPALPAGFPCPVLIAQHIADGFADGMVEWLGGLCRLPVRLAAEGERLQAGVIYISPSEHHATVTPQRLIALVARGPHDIYHPSCDLLLTSVAKVFGSQAVGIILTGMSSDGAKGIARIRAKGGMTLAQDEASSVIFGMNRVAIEAGSVQQVLPLGVIAVTMTQLAAPWYMTSSAGVTP